MAKFPIVLSDVVNKNGHIQNVEFWTGLGDGAISGDATLLQIITARINAGFDRVMPLFYSFSSYIKWDDPTQTDLPMGTFPIVANQSDYTISTDVNLLEILSIAKVRILPSATSTVYQDLELMTSDDPRASDAMSPNPTDVGVPSYFLKHGNTIYLYLQPNYNATAKIFFEREANYFTTDATQEIGIPRPFQELIDLYASHDWLTVNKPDNQMLITRLEGQIAKREQALQNAIDARNPHIGRLGVVQQDNH